MIGRTIRELLKNEVNRRSFESVVEEALKDEKIQPYQTIIFGHLHKYHVVEKNNKTFIFLSAFVDDQTPYIVKSGFYEYLVISDLHIGSSLWGNKQSRRLNQIIEEVKNSKKKKLILLGDVIELWTQDPHKVVKKYKNILQKFKQLQEMKKLIWVRGNHDWSIKEYVDIDVVDYYTVSKKHFFIHSHQYDPVMNSSWYKKLWLWVWLRWGDELWRVNNLLKWWKK